MAHIHTEDAKLSVPIWIAIWAVAISVTLIGGNSEAVNWRPTIQMPGSFVVLYLGWFIGPLDMLMTPLVFGILTIIVNVAVYYLLVVVTRLLWRKFKVAS